MFVRTNPASLSNAEEHNQEREGEGRESERETEEAEEAMQKC